VTPAGATDTPLRAVIHPRAGYPASAATALSIGLMSGTSLDGMDGVLVRWHRQHDAFETLGRAHVRFEPGLRQDLLALNVPGSDELHRAALAANRLSVDAAALVAELLAQARLVSTDVAAIGLHGQTVRHRPGEFDGMGYTLQLHNASLLAELTGIDVICDFRSRDVAAGGQGAPLVPAFHFGVFHQPGQDVAVLNLGGIANLTLLQGDGLIGGYDCGPANVLMDLWAQQHLSQAFDADGAWAASGVVLPTLLGPWQEEPFFWRQGPKSTGRELFSSRWLNMAPLSGHRPEDVQATLCELTAWCVDLHLARDLPAAQRLWVCGGGAFNGELMRRLQHHMKSRLGDVATVTTTSPAGLDPLDVEATAFAWLAWRFLQGEPGNVIAVTGARGPRVLGAFYPGGR